MKISARNVLKGKVVRVTSGAINAEIVIELAGGDQIISMITKESAEKLGLGTGKAVYAVVKASNVMVAID